MPDFPSIRELLRPIGVEVIQAEQLSTGATSDVWKVQAADQTYVLKFFRTESDHPPSYESEFAIRSRLIEAGMPVARPVATNADSPVDNEGPPWALDEFVPGTFAERSEIPVQAAQDLGQALRELHALYAEGYGRLENWRDRLKGRADDVAPGVMTRLHMPWPFTGEAIFQHPVAKLAPELLSRLAAVERAILSHTAAARRSIVHCDLHNGQLILAEERLAALIDFGDAMVGAPEWDIASFLYFHGEEQTDQLLKSYTAAPSEATDVKYSARLLSIVIALHHIGRSFVLNRPRRREFALPRLVEVLDDLS